MEITWCFFLSFLLIGYIVLDGFDLGIGILFPLVTKNEGERHLILKAIGPIWDGNKVWMIVAGGVRRLSQITRAIHFFEDFRGSYELND